MEFDWGTVKFIVMEESSNRMLELEGVEVTTTATMFDKG